jgi:signal transduction histidine kinase
MLDGPGVWATAVDALRAPLAVVEDGQVVDANPAFRERFDGGGSLSALFEDEPALRAAVRAGREEVIDLETDPGSVAVHTASLSGNGDSPDDRGSEGAAKVVLLHDVTECERERQDLRRQNEQLDRFASLISHDLRNPLDVALGRTNVLRERVDDPEVAEQLAEISDAHSRMQRIITDVLTLARQGEEIDDCEPVEVADLARTAWANVATEGATLEVTADRTVTADPDRLSQVFENLFRNAVEHAGPAVTVTVGDLPGGFYVADDGPGIPEADRERVLEAGATGDGSGTGLGLAIVEQVVGAHGWNLAVTDSETGGARFEVTGDGGRD